MNSIDVHPDFVQAALSPPGRVQLPANAHELEHATLKLLVAAQTNIFSRLLSSVEKSQSKQIVLKLLFRMTSLVIKRAMTLFSLALMTNALPSKTLKTLYKCPVFSCLLPSFFHLYRAYSSSSDPSTLAPVFEMVTQFHAELNKVNAALKAGKLIFQHEWIPQDNTLGHDNTPSQSMTMINKLICQFIVATLNESHR